MRERPRSLDHPIACTLGLRLSTVAVFNPYDSTHFYIPSFAGGPDRALLQRRGKYRRCLLMRCLVRFRVPRDLQTGTACQASVGRLCRAFSLIEHRFALW